MDIRNNIEPVVIKAAIPTRNSGTVIFQHFSDMTSLLTARVKKKNSR